MLYVLFYVCSIANQNLCRQEVMQISEQPLTPQMCYMYAQPQLAKWNQYRPNQHIEKYKCVDDNYLQKMREKDI